MKTLLSILFLAVALCAQAPTVQQNPAPATVGDDIELTIKNLPLPGDNTVLIEFYDENGYTISTLTFTVTGRNGAVNGIVPAGCESARVKDGDDPSGWGNWLFII